MGRWGVGVFVIAALTLFGCAGSNGSAAAPATTTTNPVPSTTVPRVTTTTSTPDFSFDDSVPPPKLVNTGTNFVAILKSLSNYSNWTAAHRPDPALMSNFIARGTKLYGLYVKGSIDLRDHGTRGIEEIGGPSRYTILSATTDAFSARVVEDILVHKTVVASGRVTSQVRFGAPTTYSMLAVRDDGRWRFAAIEIVERASILR